MSSRGLATEHSSRIEALKTKHSIIKARIDEAQKRPSTADFYIRQLKKQKLLLKEEIEGIRKAS